MIIIVTRYFGGILLGTGGLVKAYSDAAKLALENGNIIEKEEGYLIEANVTYEEIKNFEHICLQNNIKIMEKEFGENIKVKAEISKEKYEKIPKNNFQKMEIKILKEKYTDKC